MESFTASRPDGDPPRAGDAGSTSRRTLVWAGVLFFLSGALGLGYELVWIRKASLVVGASQIALATVLACFFLGLGLGSLLVARFRLARQRSPLFVYGLFELGIGGLALLFPWLFGGLELAYAALYPLADGSGAALLLLRFALLLALLLPPTMLMGGTLPLLLDGLVARDRPAGAWASCLYGVNVLGAVAGVLATGYLAIPLLGLDGSSRWFGAGNLLLGAGALFAFRAERPLHPSAAAGLRLPRLHSATAALAGFLAISWQVVWARWFSLVEATTVYLTTMLLAVYLTGLAAGSVLLSPLLARGVPPVLVLVVVSALGPAVALLTPGLWAAIDFAPRILSQATEVGGFRPLEELQVHPRMAWLSESLDETLASPFLRVGVVVLLPVLLLGAALPALIAAASPTGAELRRAAGRLVFWNTLGASAGAFAAGYVLLPGLGLHHTMTALALGGLGLAAWWLGHGSVGGVIGRRGLVAAAASCLLAALPLVWHAAARPDLTRATIEGLGWGRQGRDHFAPEAERQVAKLVAVREGPVTTAFLLEDDERIQLGSGCVSMAGIAKRGVPGQAIQGHLPVLFYPGPGLPQRCLGICLGSGQSFGALLMYPIRELDVADIAPSIVELAVGDLASYNHDLGRDPRVRIFLDDGRHFVERSAPERYDVISMEPPPPTADGVQALYSREFYEAARRALAPGGVLMQWLPLYRVTPLDAASILRTQASVFPESFVVKQGTQDFMVLSYKQRPVFVAEAMRARLATFRQERLVAGARWSPACQHDIASFEGLLSMLLIGPGELMRIAAPQLLDDDRQALAYGLGDRWLLWRYRGHFLARITFAALPETPMASFAPYFDPPLGAAQCDASTVERAAALQFYGVPDPARIRKLQDDFRAAKDATERARLALEAAALNDAWLDKPKVFELIGVAIRQRPEHAEPAAIETVRRAVRHGFGAFAGFVLPELDVLERAFGRVPLVLAMREEAVRLSAREEARLERYWLR